MRLTGNLEKRKRICLVGIVHGSESPNVKVPKYASLAYAACFSTHLSQFCLPLRSSFVVYGIDVSADWYFACLRVDSRLNTDNRLVLPGASPRGDQKEPKGK